MLKDRLKEIDGLKHLRPCPKKLAQWLGGDKEKNEKIADFLYAIGNNKHCLLKKKKKDKSYTEPYRPIEETNMDISTTAKKAAEQAQDVANALSKMTEEDRKEVKILVVGASIAGLTFIETLKRRKFKNYIDITLIDYHEKEYGFFSRIRSRVSTPRNKINSILQEYIPWTCDNHKKPRGGIFKKLHKSKGKYASDAEIFRKYSKKSLVENTYFNTCLTKVELDETKNKIVAIVKGKQEKRDSTLPQTKPVLSAFDMIFLATGPGLENTESLSHPMRSFWDSKIPALYPHNAAGQQYLIVGDGDSACGAAFSYLFANDPVDPAILLEEIAESNAKDELKDHITEKLEKAVKKAEHIEPHSSNTELLKSLKKFIAKNKVDEKLSPTEVLHLMFLLISEEEFFPEEDRYGTNNSLRNKLYKSLILDEHHKHNKDKDKHDKRALLHKNITVTIRSKRPSICTKLENGLRPQTALSKVWPENRLCIEILKLLDMVKLSHDKDKLDKDKILEGFSEEYIHPARYFVPGPDTPEHSSENKKFADIQICTGKRVSNFKRSAA